MKAKRVSEHLETYERKTELDDVAKKILGLVSEIENVTKKDKGKIRILDVGCGIGMLVEALTVKGYDVLGIDFDENCVEITKNYGKAMLMDAAEIAKSFEQDFDLVIFRDSLEHMNNPLDVLNQAKAISRWIIIAVPNPARPVVLMYNIIRRNYSCPGHLCCWDRSHLHYFLTNKADLEIVKWEPNEIRLLADFLHAFPATLKRLGLNIISPVEGKILPRIFPYFSTKLIVLTRVKFKVD